MYGIRELDEHLAKQTHHSQSLRVPLQESPVMCVHYAVLVARRS